MRQSIEVPAPTATQVTAWVGDRASELHLGDDGLWRGEVQGDVGERYWLSVDGGPPLVDPRAADLEFADGRPWSLLREGWPSGPSLGRHHPHPVIYELHVRGFAGEFSGVEARLDLVAGLGVDVVELMPIHPFDTSDNYWGYMPVIWGAVHRPYAADPDRAPEELCAMVAAAHQRDLEVWVDVVFNHAGEGDWSMPTWSLRGLDPQHCYRYLADGTPANDSGCGNDIDPADPYVRRLVLEALDRYADLGIDGFRFDLASLLTRDGGGLVAEITEWAARRQVTLVAEAWDLGMYQVGSPIWPEAWRQWNDRFRDDVRGFMAMRPGLASAVAQRVAGSPDVFAAPPWRGVNFVTAHDGLTMFDLTLVDNWNHRAWNPGAELRPQQIRNYFVILLLSLGPAMFVMGDEFGRSQGGDPNPYNIDGPTTWVDWALADEWSELTDFVRQAIALRGSWQPGPFVFHGVDEQPDFGDGSHSLAWRSGNLYVLANAWSEPLTFGIYEGGEWEPVLATGPYGAIPGHVLVAAHCIVVLRRR